MSEWATVALGDAIDFFDSKRIPLSAMERAKRRGEFPYYGASGIIDWIDDYIFDGRYLLVAEDGENLNSRKLPVAFFAEGKFWVNNHAHIVRGKSGVLDDVFLQQWLLHADIGGYITGSAQPKLSQANMKRIHIGLPPLPTQRKIAAFLSGYDDLIDNNKRRIKLLEEMAQRIYREWFVDFRYPGHKKVPLVGSELGPLPKDWEVASLGTVAENSDRRRKPLSGMVRTLRPGRYPYYGAAKIFDFIDDFIFDGTYLLMAEDGSVITPDGKAVLQYVSGKFWANNHTHILQGTRLSTEHLYLLLADLPISGYITGAAQPKITQANMNRIPCIVPGHEVRARFDAIAQPLFEELQLVGSQVSNLRATRDLLLPLLISGEIDVADLDIMVPEAAA